MPTKKLSAISALLEMANTSFAWCWPARMMWVSLDVYQPGSCDTNHCMVFCVGLLYSLVLVCVFCTLTISNLLDRWRIRETCWCCNRSVNAAASTMVTWALIMRKEIWLLLHHQIQFLWEEKLPYSLSSLSWYARLLCLEAICGTQDPRGSRPAVGRLCIVHAHGAHLIRLEHIHPSSLLSTHRQPYIH